ncbi:hypothetical protein LCGC14_2860470 [marine sediment metagenome]|uniref:Uncharacterized protein n=1 Tax=marine sediment metagenome TaxID=412755 RepID=A0A0F8Y5N3_9ZZZZ
MSCRKVVIESPYAGDVEANRDFARRCIELGAGFTAVGIDLLLLNDATIALAQEFGLPG